ncbi:MAG: hypothetical protein HFE62_01525 [Firmicutes bacterium]|nr:hypothetical protein [Bacillota bacterium]
MKKFVDEREELLKLKIGARGFVIVALALAISVITKSFVLNLDKSYYLTEQMILLAGCLYYGISSVYMGLDAKRFEGHKWIKNILISMVIILAIPMIFLIKNVVQGNSVDAMESLAFLGSFVASYSIAVAIAVYARKKRAESISKKYEE